MSNSNDQNKNTSTPNNPFGGKTTKTTKFSRRSGFASYAFDQRIIDAFEQWSVDDLEKKKANTTRLAKVQYSEERIEELKEVLRKVKGRLGQAFDILNVADRDVFMKLAMSMGYDVSKKVKPEDIAIVLGLYMRNKDATYKTVANRLDLNSGTYVGIIVTALYAYHNRLDCLDTEEVEDDENEIVERLLRVATPSESQASNTKTSEPGAEVISTAYDENTNKVVVRGRLDYMLLVEVEDLNAPVTIGTYFPEENSAVIYHRPGVIVDSDKESTDVGREK